MKIIWKASKEIKTHIVQTRALVAFHMFDTLRIFNKEKSAQVTQPILFKCVWQLRQLQ